MAKKDLKIYQTMGGTAACRKLAVAFYARVQQDPILRPLFPGKTLNCAIEEFTAFLVRFLGGPSEDAQRRWWLSLRESHQRFKIGEKERDAWMKNMLLALDEVQLGEPANGALRGLFEQSSAYVVNTGRVAREKPGDGMHPEIAQRWDVQRALDEAVAAVHRGRHDEVVALTEGIALQPFLKCYRAVFAALLARMISSKGPDMLNYVHKKLRDDPALAHEQYSRGRTLLHAAAGAGSVTTVDLLLQLGADSKSTNDGGHTPLYCVANECATGAGGAVVRILVQAGAIVDACDGVKRCTPLHMAARRDNVGVAKALLDCGADIEARDSLGDTPLRRSVNCDKVGVAALLLSRGADSDSQGSKGRTPKSAARSNAMRKALESPGLGPSLKSRH